METQSSNIFDHDVMNLFQQISRIPRDSGSEKAISDWIRDWAQERSIEVEQDDIWDLILRKPASAGYEDHAPLLLQAHIDMVCEKDSSSNHDFAKDPIELKLDGDWIVSASGTTLGADDGIGMAMILAVLDDDSLAHPPIEALFTNDEEIGLLGAAGFDASVFKGRRMINLDSETEGELTCGCAGGETIFCVLPVEKIRMKGLPVVITISGLKGGHSGAEIHCWRANANKLAARLLNEIQSVAAYSLESISGGEKDNAIPTEARIRLVIDEEDYQPIVKAVESFEKSVRREFRGIDDGIRVKLERGTVHKVDVLSMDSQDKVFGLLLCLPNGIFNMSGTTPGMVQTSCNLGVVRTGETEFVCTIGARSSVLSGRSALELQIRALAEMFGAAVRTESAYPAWEFRENSALRDTMSSVYEEMYGKAPAIVTIHAGLECGLFTSAVRGLDAVSMGCTVLNIHTPAEKLSISSTARTWDYLKQVLASLK